LIAFSLCALCPHLLTLRRQTVLFRLDRYNRKVAAEVEVEVEAEVMEVAVMAVAVAETMAALPEPAAPQAGETGPEADC